MDDLTIKMDQVHSIALPMPARNIVLTNGQGLRAVIDFSGDRVTFSGDLPVDEAAQKFFDAVGHLLRAK